MKKFFLACVLMCSSLVAMSCGGNEASSSLGGLNSSSVQTSSQIKESSSVIGESSKKESSEVDFSSTVKPSSSKVESTSVAPTISSTVEVVVSASEAKDHLVLDVDGQTVTEGFDLPSSFTYLETNFTITWESSSDLVVIGELNNGVYPVTIDFEEKLSSDLEVALTAIIENGEDFAVKGYSVIIPKNETIVEDAPLCDYINFYFADNNSVIGELSGVVTSVGSNNGENYAVVMDEEEVCYFIYNNTISSTDWTSKFVEYNNVTITSGIVSVTDYRYLYVIDSMDKVTVDGIYSDELYLYEFSEYITSIDEVYSYQGLYVEVIGQYSYKDNKHICTNEYGSIEILENLCFYDADFSILKEGVIYSFAGLLDTCGENLILVPIAEDYALSDEDLEDDGEGEIIPDEEFLEAYFNAENDEALGTFSGVVTACGNKSANNMAAVKVDGGAVYVFNNTESASDFKSKFTVGNMISISNGTKDCFNGLHEYVISSLDVVSVISTGNDASSTIDITNMLSDDLELLQANIVTVTGVCEVSNSKYYIDVDGHSIQIYADRAFGSYTLSNYLTNGVSYTVTGLLGWYNGAQINPLDSNFAVETSDEDEEVVVPSENNVKFTQTTFDNRLDKDGPLTEGCFPSVGNPNLLVIPVNLDDSQKTDENLNDIKIAFTGTSEETGWESVKSYYYKSSYGKLDMEVTVLDEWFTPSKSMNYYNSYSDDYDDGSTLILREALEYYDDVIDFNDYDYNDDGFIDGVWLVYNCAVDYESDSSIYWAYVYWNYEEVSHDGKDAYFYAWAGIDFMHPTKEEAGSYDPTDITVDAHTYIHETGHLMGLDDYYDYDTSVGANKDGYYGADMMDYNVGDHGPISKLLLGWISPIVVSGSGYGSITLESFTTTGDVLLIADHDISSIYDTYYLVEFYTNDGLNSHDMLYNSDTVDYGIRIMIIRAEKNIVNGEVEYNSGSAYQTGFKYDNSDESKMFVDGVYDISPDMYDSYSVDADCLFQQGESMSKSSIFFSLVVDEMTKETATITIILK